MKAKTKKIIKYSVFGTITAGACAILYLTFKTNVSEDDARIYTPKFFPMSDLFKSNTATQYGIDNTTNDKDINNNLKSLCKAVVDPAIEDYIKTYGGSVSVNSGYRSPKVNELVGGESDSQHLKGEAVDITTGSKEGNKKLFEIIIRQNKFDQLINENNYQWVHVSFKRTGYNRQDKRNL